MAGDDAELRRAVPVLGVLLVGLSSIIATMGWWFDWVRIAGAVYLVWIGWKLLRWSGEINPRVRTPAPRGGFFLQGFLVLISNPKALLLLCSDVGAAGCCGGGEGRATAPPAAHTPLLLLLLLRRLRRRRGRPVHRRPPAAAQGRCAG